MVLTIAYGRFLGDVKLGELYFATYFVGLIGFPIDAGFNQQLTRDVAQEPSKALRYITNILCFKFILWILLYGVILLLSWLLDYPSEIRFLIIIQGIMLLTSSISSAMGALHYAFERVVFSVVASILEKGLDGLVGTILLFNGADVKVMGLVLLCGSCASMLWQTFWVLRLVGLPFTFDVPLARKLIRTSIPFIVSGAIVIIYYRIDTVLLYFMTSTAVVGWYGAAYRIFDTLVFLPSLVINAIMYPVFSKLSVHSEDELKLAVEKSLNFLLFCCIPICTGLIVVAPSIVGFLYHQADFSNTIPAMQFLAPGLLFLYTNSVLTAVLISTGREKKITIMALVALVFNLGLNLLLIPPFKHVGAAALTSATECLLMFLSLIFIPRSLWPVGSIKVALKAFLAAGLMGVVVWLLRDYSLLVILPVAALVYFPAATLLGTIPPEDMKAFYTSIRNRKKGKTTSEDASFLTDEDMQVEQEFLLALGHEMTNPILPAFKSNMTSPVLPAFKVEMTTIIPTHKRPDMSRPSEIVNQATMRLSDSALPSRTDEIAQQATRPLANTPQLSRLDKIAQQATTHLPNTPQFSSIDEEATLPLIDAIRRTKAQK
jgi:O-antigen/teichoic acid export membrane protein